MNPDKLDENGLGQLTLWLSPGGMIQTMYNDKEITHTRWLELEVERITAKGGRCEIKNHPSTRDISLWVEPVVFNPTTEYESRVVTEGKVSHG